MQMKGFLCSLAALASSSVASDESLSLIQIHAHRGLRDACDDAKEASNQAKQSFNDLKKQMKDLKASLKAAKADMKSKNGDAKGACKGSKKSKKTSNVYESAPGVGGWGGMCTCPDGQQYNVGDMNDACGSLACVGGTPGPCERVGRAERTGMKATCGSAPEKKSKKSTTPPAGNFDVFYQGGQRSVGAVVDCSGIIEQPGIFKEQLQTEGVAQKCSQARDAKATFFVMNTHGAGKYECLWVDGDNLVGSHYTGPNAYWGTIEYRRTSSVNCGPPKKSKKAKVIEGPISAVIVSEYDTYDGRFPAKNVLDSTWQGGSHNNGQTYLTRNCGGGWFVMQMQDVGAIKEFHILNTCNTPYNDRSAKDITISLSSDNSNWDTVLNYQMQRCTPIKGDPLVLPNPEPIKAQYIKVELKTCYGASAGLNYFQAFR
jgi:hypothetical protein